MSRRAGILFCRVEGCCHVITSLKVGLLQEDNWSSVSEGVGGGGYALCRAVGSKY
jgi:hypothetical protein